MKNVFFGLAFMLVGTLTFANNGKTNTSEELPNVSAEVEYIYVDSNCYVRWCRLEGTEKHCTPWNQIPCEKGFIGENKQPIAK